VSTRDMKLQLKPRIAWALIGLLLPALAPAAAAAGEAEFVPGELLVRFEPGTSPTERDAAAAEADAQVEERIAGVPRLYLLELPSGLSPRDGDRALEGADDVAYAHPNFLYRSQATPNDPEFINLWGLNNTLQFGGTADADIDAPEAWDLTMGDPAVQLAVIDSGVATTHPDLTGNIWANLMESGGTPGVDDDTNGKIDDVNGWDFLDEDPNPADSSSHGTHVAGTAGAVGNNNVGTTGVNWDVSLMALRAGRADGTLPIADIVEAIAYAAAEGAQVVNMSFSGPSNPPSLPAAISGASGVLFVAAAGNGGSDGAGDNLDSVNVPNEFPCEEPLANVICVAASNQADSMPGFSNFGTVAVDLAAPGTTTQSTVPIFTPAIFSDNFEGALNWTFAGTLNAWAVTTERPFSPTRSLSDSPFVPPLATPAPQPETKKKGCKAKKTKRARKKCRRKKRRAQQSALYYSPGADNSATLTNPVNLTGRDGCRVSFNTAYSFAGSDRVAIEGSSDGVSFSEIDELRGSSNGESVTVDLGVFDDVPTFYLRFHLLASSSADGIYIDDVQIQCAASYNYSFKQGTSMATPHVAGAAALMLARCPAYTPENLRAALLTPTNVDVKPSLAGRVATGGRLNLEKMLSLGDPTAPPPTC
jgi:subtilisin family serine protease